MDGTVDLCLAGQQVNQTGPDGGSIRNDLGDVIFI